VGTTYHLNKEEELYKIIFGCYLNIKELDKSVQAIEYHFDITMELDICFVLANHTSGHQMLIMSPIGILLNKVRGL
jgi:hypothetical protein